MAPKLLAVAGSVRQHSFNRKALEYAVCGARDAGAEVTVLDLKSFSLPLFDEDWESANGIPDNAIMLKQLFGDNQGLLFACPEYNSSITPLLKNTLDWISRPYNGHSGLAPYQNKIAALLSASAGGLGGLRGLRHVREILTTLGVLVIPRQQVVSHADKVFSSSGDQQHIINGIRETGKALAEATFRMNK
jgi:chromate reductase, NAD(P)H dehydrogenase (quinone)